MDLFKLDEDTWINKDEIATIQSETIWGEDGHPSGSIPYIKFNGTRIVLKNGSKLFVKEMSPDEVMEKLASRRCDGESGDKLAAALEKVLAETDHPFLEQALAEYRGTND